MSANNGRMRTIEVVDDAADVGGNVVSNVEMHTEQLAKLYKITTRQMNKLILAVAEKGYNMEARIGERSRRYWSPEQQFLIKKQHSNCLEVHPEAQKQQAEERVQEFQSQFTDNDRSQEVDHELTVLSTQSTLVKDQLNDEWNQGANLAVAGVRSRFQGYVTTLPIAEKEFNKAVQELKQGSPAIPDRELTEREIQAIRGCLF